jgi:hypothetical protein
MKLSLLFNSLPIYIQNLIKIYYLSYGTTTSNILRSYLTALPADSKMSAWRRKMLRRPNTKLLPHRITGFIAAFELNIAFLKDEPDSELKRELYRENINSIVLMFRAKISTFVYPILYGTPTGILMRNYIHYFRKYDKPEEQNTIWRIKVRTTGGILTDKKFNDIKSVCLSQVYNELTAAYNAK